MSGWLLAAVLVLGVGLLVAALFLINLKGWQNVRRWRSRHRFRDLPVPVRILVALAVLLGLVGGVLLGEAVEPGRSR
jgi:hypothetical protein